MRVAHLVIAVAIAGAPAMAQPRRAVHSTEVIVVTGIQVDPSKLSDKERLAHVCQAAGLLKKHLQIQQNKDLVITMTVDWFLRLSCGPVKSD